MVQALRAGDKAKRVEFSNAILRCMKDGNFLPRLIFSNEATFYFISAAKLTATVSEHGGSKIHKRFFRTSPKFPVG